MLNLILYLMNEPEPEHLILDLQFNQNDKRCLIIKSWLFSDIMAWMPLTELQKLMRIFNVWIVCFESHMNNKKTILHVCCCISVTAHTKAGDAAVKSDIVIIVQVFWYKHVRSLTNLLVQQKTVAPLQQQSSWERKIGNWWLWSDTFQHFISIHWVCVCVFEDLLLVLMGSGRLKPPTAPPADRISTTVPPYVGQHPINIQSISTASARVNRSTG